VHYPELRILKDYPFEKIERQLRSEAERLGAEYLDLREVVRDVEPAKLWVTMADPHPNGYANSLFAKVLFDKVRTLRNNASR
jgi:hypothetical protein